MERIPVRILAPLAVALALVTALVGCASPAEVSSANVAVSGVPIVEKAAAANVIDGDTLDVEFADSTADRIRLYAVDTPETYGGEEPFGPEASDFVETAVAGRRLWIETGSVQRDRYDRLLAYVWLERPASRTDAEVREKMLNARLLEEGYAEVYEDSQDRTYMELFRQIEAEAREARRGRWGMSSAP